MKKIISILLAVFFTVTAAACGSTPSVPSSAASVPEMVESTLNPFDAAPYGTYPGNINTAGGGAIMDQNTIYYSRLDAYTSETKEYRLWKYDFTAQSHSQLTEFRTDSLNLWEGRIFYIKNGDKMVYSIKTDGSDVKQLTQEAVNKLLIYEGKLYCLTDTELYTIAPDGTGKSVIYAGKCTGIWFDSGVTYIIGNDNQVCTLNGGTATPIENVFAYSIVVNNGWIYFLNTADSSRVYKVRTDGTDMRKLYAGISENLMIADGMLYFVSIDIGYTLIRIDCNGNNKILINNDRANGVNIAGEYMLYNDMRSNDMRLLKIGQNTPKDFLYM